MRGLDRSDVQGVAMTADPEIWRVVRWRARERKRRLRAIASFAASCAIWIVIFTVVACNVARFGG